MIKRIGVLTSGGDSPGMNAAIRAITRSAIRSGLEVVGIRDGYKGLMNEEFEEFNVGSVSDILWRGGTILGCGRLPEFKQEEVQLQAVEILKKHNVDALVCIGGDGTYRGALDLVKHGFNCICLPGTIDNDVEGTDFTIGYDTALDTIVSCIDKLKDTSISHHRCSVVEVMGNECGDLAINSGIAVGAEIVITPETGFDEKEVLERVKYYDELGKNHAIVVVSEKMCDVNDLAKKIKEYTTFSGTSSILGYIQRGGSPSTNDRVLAARMGVKAIEFLLEGKVGQAVSIRENSIFADDLEKIVNMPRSSRQELYDLFEILI